MQIKTDVSNYKLVNSLSGRLDTVTSPQFEEKTNLCKFDEIDIFAKKFKCIIL